MVASRLFTDADSASPEVVSEDSSGAVGSASVSVVSVLVAAAAAAMSSSRFWIAVVGEGDIC